MDQTFGQCLLWYTQRRAAITGSIFTTAYSSILYKISSEIEGYESLDQQAVKTIGVIWRAVMARDGTQTLGDPITYNAPLSYQTTLGSGQLLLEGDQGFFWRGVYGIVVTWKGVLMVFLLENGVFIISPKHVSLCKITEIRCFCAKWSKFVLLKHIL